MNLVAEQSWRGTWWVADEPDVQRDGILRCGDDGRLRLELVGGFNVTTRKPLPDGGSTVDPAGRRFPLIHGTAAGQQFTLIETYATRSTGGLVRPDEQDLSSNRALQGIHLRSLDEAVFETGHIQFERLLAWAHRTTIDLDSVAEISGPSGEQTVIRRPLPAVVTVHEGIEIKLRVRSNDFNITHRPSANRRVVESVEWAVLDFTPEAGLSTYNAFDRLDKDMQDLLTLCSYDACGSLKQSLIYRGSEAHPASTHHPIEVSVMGRQVYHPQPVENEPGHHIFLFTLAELDFAELVPRWLALKETARTACNTLFGLRYISTGYVGTRLLGVASAAEGLHQAIRPESTPLPNAQYRALKKKLISAIADEPDDVRQFVNAELRNKPTLYHRLLDLASIPDQQAVDALIKDRSAWATALKDSRNDLAHANERESGDESVPAVYLLEVTYALLCLVLMAELGISGETQRKALDHPGVEWVARRFNAATPAGP